MPPFFLACCGSVSLWRLVVSFWLCFEAQVGSKYNPNSQSYGFLVDTYVHQVFYTCRQIINIFNFKLLILLIKIIVVSPIKFNFLWGIWGILNKFFLRNPKRMILYGWKTPIGLGRTITLKRTSEILCMRMWTELKWLRIWSNSVFFNLIILNKSNESLKSQECFSQRFIELEGSLRRSQQPVTDPYPETD
jgi:hypothetical protein